MSEFSKLLSGLSGWISSSDEAKAALLVFFLTALARIAYLLTSTLYQWAAERVGRRIESCAIKLGPLPIPRQRRDRLRHEVPIYCLIIRYGDDAYLEKLASDQERYEGRLRFEILRSTLKLDEESCTYSGTIPLKVHRRLGTQFKLFFEVEDSEVGRYVSALSAMTDIIAEVTTSKYTGKPKVWFLLKRFHITSIVNSAGQEQEVQIRNNFYFPI